MTFIHKHLIWHYGKRACVSFFHLRLRSAYRRFSEMTPLRGCPPITNRMSVFLADTNIFYYWYPLKI